MQTCSDTFELVGPPRNLGWRSRLVFLRYKAQELNYSDMSIAASGGDCKAFKLPFLQVYPTRISKAGRVYVRYGPGGLA